jgi:phosphatidylserine/phosphatidylglycerophosphate/cardiolipin synthase-like enzyme
MALPSVPKQHGPTQGALRSLSTVLVLLAQLSAVSLCWPSQAPAAEVAPARVAVYFSPNGGATDAVVRAIGAAQTQILVQAYSFTSAPIAKALVDAHKRGVKVQAVLDKSNVTQNYSAATFLVNVGIPTLIDAEHAIAHSKVMVIDSTTIITGSFNFSKAAEEKNVENLLIITEAPALVTQYEANIQAHAKHSQPYSRQARAAAQVVTDAGGIRGNRNSKVYRLPNCKRYTEMTSTSVVQFATEADAKEAGYRRAKDCG